MIYLDNAATTRIAPEVFNAMLPYLLSEYGNPGALYEPGRKAASAISTARQQVADFLHCKPEQIVFTSGGSEANSTVFYGLKDSLQKAGKTKIITDESEHDSVLRAVESLRIKDGFDVAYLPVKRDGTVDETALEKELSTKNTGIVSVMYMNNETGAVNRVNRIGKICQENGVLFHTDCVQAASCLGLDVDEIGCDFLSLSGHKLHGPKGVGVLYVRDKTRLSPLVCGGEAQEFGLRGGTENVPGIVGLGAACQFGQERKAVFDLAELFVSELLENLSQLGLEKIFAINGPMDYFRKIVNLCFDGVDGETLVLMLDAKGVCISAGSACRSRESKPSKALLAMGLTPKEAMSSIRVSFSRYNTRDEIIRTAKIMADTVGFLYERQTRGDET